MTVRRSGVVAALLALLGSRPSSAEEARRAPPNATVVAIDSGDLVIDLGTKQGISEGQVVELWRPLRVRHPVTNQVLVDRFRIGSVHLTQVQVALSLAKVEGDFMRPPQAGDLVFLPSDARPAAPSRAPEGVPPASSAPSSASQPSAVRVVVPADPDAQALSDLFVSLQGTDPSSRIRVYQSFVAARPKSRFARVLGEEVEALRIGAKEVAPYQVSSAPLERARPGVPQRFAIELDPRFVGAVLHVRRRGSPAYRTLAMESLGPRYWAATLPGDAIAEPAMEYFVEGVSPSGGAAAVVGTADQPKDAVVDPHPLTGKQPGTLAQVNLQSEYATFNTKKANDYLFQTEGQFGWRVREVGIRAIRSGFGVFRGKGGSLADLDALGKDPKRVGFTYGYVEGEIGLTPTFALIGRPIIGLRQGGVGGGAQGLLRIGNDLRTNLLIGGEILGEVGMRGIVELDWRTIHRVPIVLRSEVTNQPAGTDSDVGARAIAQVGYELVRDFTIAGRVSYQGRTINHAGPGAGLGVSYQW